MNRRPSTGVPDFAAQDSTACGVRLNGRLVCWGNDGEGASPPGGRFESVDGGGAHACGVKASGPPSGQFDSVSVGESSACAVRTNGTVTCWGTDFSGETMPRPGVTFSSVSIFGLTACGVRTDGVLQCWGFPIRMPLY